jgi:hypothetical protein
VLLNPVLESKNHMRQHGHNLAVTPNQERITVPQSFVDIDITADMSFAIPKLHLGITISRLWKAVNK